MDDAKSPGAPQETPDAGGGAPPGARSPGRSGDRRGPKRAPKPPPIPERTPDPEHLIIGRVVAAHGVRGEFRMAVLTNHPEHLPSLRTIYLGDDLEPQRVRRIQPREGGKGEAIVNVAAFTSPGDAAARRGQLVRIARADAPPLPEGEFYHYQLLGLDVVDLDGQPLGRLAQIIETGANDVYVVVGPVGEQLLPAIEDVIREIDPARGRMVVKPPEYY